MALYSPAAVARDGGRGRLQPLQLPPSSASEQLSGEHAPRSRRTTHAVAGDRLPAGPPGGADARGLEGCDGRSTAGPRVPRRPSTTGAGSPTQTSPFVARPGNAEPHRGHRRLRPRDLRRHHRGGASRQRGRRHLRLPQNSERDELRISCFPNIEPDGVTTLAAAIDRVVANLSEESTAAEGGGRLVVPAWRSSPAAASSSATASRPSLILPSTRGAAIGALESMKDVAASAWALPRRLDVLVDLGDLVTELGPGFSDGLDPGGRTLGERGHQVRRLPPGRHKPGWWHPRRSSPRRRSCERQGQGKTAPARRRFGGCHRITASGIVTGLLAEPGGAAPGSVPG